MKRLHKQLGISLVEIMVALVISLFLLGGIIQVYTANKSSYAFTDAIGRVQENARFAVDTVAQDLRMAGFFGCTAYDPSDTENITNNLDPDGTDYDPLLHDYAGLGVLDGSEGDGPNGSDSITIRGAKPVQFNILPPFNVTTSDDINVTVDLTGKLENEDIVMISNCQGADIFQITADPVTDTDAGLTTVEHAIGGEPGNINTDPGCADPAKLCLSQTYGNDASLFEVQTVTYEIRNVAGEPTLFRVQYNDEEELVEGVEQMQVEYGIDTTNDGFPNQYVPYSNTLVVNDVIVVRLMLLMRSDTGANVGGPQTVTFNGNDLTFNDNRLRQVFTSTIALRNRIGNST